MPSTSRKNLKSVNSSNISNISLNPSKKPIISNKIDLTPTEKSQSNTRSNENLNISAVSQTLSSQIIPSNSKINSFSQMLNKNPYSLANNFTPQLFEMDLFTNSERKINTGFQNTTPLEQNKGYSVSQIQKLKIDLAEKQRKNSKSRSNSLIRNVSTDGDRKKMFEKNFKKKQNNETLKKTAEKNGQPIGSYVNIFLNIK